MKMESDGNLFTHAKGNSEVPNFTTLTKFATTLGVL